MIATWRLVEARFADAAFEGEGAWRHGGRWNSPGFRVVYTSQTSSLATLELLTRLIKPQELPDYMLIPCYFHEVLVETLDRRRLPRNWRATPAPTALQEIGNEWLLARSFAVLQVPSVVNPNESNFLLNPAHENFKSIDIGQPTPFTIDYRLVT